MTKKKSTKVEALKHKDAKRKNIPTAELEDVMEKNIKTPIQVAYERRNKDLDPQLVWRGKEQQDSMSFNVSVPPLYIQEKVQPKAIIEGLRNDTKSRDEGIEPEELRLFNDFNGLPNIEAATEFYEHDQNWSNRMICGDSMSVMASLSKREGLRGKVQCIYIDPPYGIKFNSNFQWSTTSTNVRDGVKEHFTNEPEQVKAFRDTWSDGIHTYLSYLRDRLIVARDLLSESGSIFVQIGDENVHRVRSMMDEVFGEENTFSIISFKKKNFTTIGQSVNDFILWYAKNKDAVKINELFLRHTTSTERPEDNTFRYLRFDDGFMEAAPNDLIDTENYPVSAVWAGTGDRVISQHYSETRTVEFNFQGIKLYPGGERQWSFDPDTGMERLRKANRLSLRSGGNSLRAIVLWNDVPRKKINNFWEDTGGVRKSVYVVQTNEKIIQRCLLMTTAPGDLVLDPTCGSGTTAYAAEQWGRRWITIDTSRVALALARSRLMGARYPYYILKDTPQGQEKEAEISQTPVKTSPTNANIRHGFVYNRVPHITLKSIAHNAEIDVIWEQMQPAVDKALGDLNNILENSNQSFQVERGARAGRSINFDKNETDKLPSGENIPHNRLLEWEVPRIAPQEWNKNAKSALEQFWKARIQRQNDIDKSIAAKADSEYLYDKPFEDNSKIRVAGPFTVESLSPHRNLAFDQNDEIIDEKKTAAKDLDISQTREPAATDFVSTILDEIKRAGVQQANKEDRIDFLSITVGGEGGGGVCSFALKEHFLKAKKRKQLLFSLVPNLVPLLNKILLSLHEKLQTRTATSLSHVLSTMMLSHLISTKSDAFPSYALA